MSKGQNLIVIPEELQKRLKKRLEENGMLMFNRIEIYKLGVAFFWDEEKETLETNGPNGGCPGAEPVCPQGLDPCCENGEWTCGICPPEQQL